MKMEKEIASGKLEWRINVKDGEAEILVPESGFWARLKGVVVGFILRIWKFFEKAWKIGVAEPKKVIHGLKVGMALCIVSLFYYMKPLYEGVGGNAMWAIMTVVVVFEYTVGATFSKCINRATATFLAGALGIGVHWVAIQSGEKFEPIIIGFSVFLFAFGATFSRFIPWIKARFDYGAMIFILTFSLVSVSGYRVDKLLEMAHERLSTIAIGTSLCIIVSMVFCPIWAGDELHQLIYRNLEKLADSLDGCIAEYFIDNGALSASDEDLNKKMQGYKCVLNSKATEESMANFARWEPAHGKFNFQHPWKNYLKIGAMMRNCAYCIETLNGCVILEIQAPVHLKKHLESVCVSLSSSSSKVFKELAMTIKTMSISSKIDLSVGEMNFAVQQLQNALKSLTNNAASGPSPPTNGPSEAQRELLAKNTSPPLMEIIPVATLVSLLIEIAARIEDVVDAVDELAGLAKFKPAKEKKPKHNQHTRKPISDKKNHETVKTSSEV